MIKTSGVVITLGGTMSNFADTHYLKDYFDEYNQLRESVYQGVKDNSSVIIYQVNSNWRRVSCLLQEIERPTECIGVGFVGSLRENLVCGQLVVPDIAVNKKSIPGGIGKANQDLVERVRERSLCQISQPISGKIYTVDSLADENTKLVSRLKSEKYLGIDMESSYLMSYYSKKSIPCAVLLVVSDNIIINPLNLKNESRGLPLTLKIENTAKKAIIVACETLLKNKLKA